ncbi:MAG: Protein TolB [Anaerolineales bacterium]|nr:Protein TolB [Anaerolineales bacterium]
MKSRKHIAYLSSLMALWVISCVTLFPKSAKQMTEVPTIAVTEDATTVPVAGVDGQIAFVQDGMIYVINTDGTGKQSLTSGTSPAWSPDGTQIAYLADVDGDLEFDIYLMNADGTNQRPISLNHPEYDTPTDLNWQANGNMIVFAAYSGADKAEWDVEIFSMDVNTAIVRQITRNRPDDWSPAWSPDGNQIAYASSDFDASINDYKGSIYVMRADGNGASAFTSAGVDTGPAFSPDGKLIAFTSARLDGNGRGTGFKVFIMNADGSGERLLVDQQIASYSKLSWSSDGQWLAITGGTTKASAQIFLVRVDGTGLTLLTDGADPAWRP